MPGSREIMIEAKGLAKRFAGVQALVGVDFVGNRGELFGFLGPNGADKTTTINLLTSERAFSMALCMAAMPCRFDLVK